MEEAEKLRISSDLVLNKIFIVGILGILFLLLSDYKHAETNEVVGCIFSSAVLVLLLYYLVTRPDLYYDSANLYIKKSSGIEIQVPFEDIQSVCSSLFGLEQRRYSYIIKYLDAQNKITTIRLFPNACGKPFSTFIKCIQKQNPKVKVSLWALGMTGFFD